MELPFETKKHFKTTINFVKPLPLNLTAFLVLEYGAGSPLWNKKVKEGIIDKNEYLVFADKNRGLGKFKKEEIGNYCQKAHKDFYVRINYLGYQFVQAFKRRDFRLLKALLKFTFQSKTKTAYWGK